MGGRRAVTAHRSKEYRVAPNELSSNRQVDMSVQPFAIQMKSPRFAIIELFGGDNNLSSYVDTDLNEMLDGLPGDGLVIALTDHFGSAAKVLELSHGRLRTLEDWGEIDTGDPVILTTFLTRALASVPADVPVAIGFWDHGSGVFDEADPGADIVTRGRAVTPRRRALRQRPRRRLFWGNRPADQQIRAMLHDDTNGGLLTTLEAGKVLSGSLAAAGRSKVEMIFSDTCLNGMVEVLAEFDTVARVVTASEDLEPGDGWDYHRWLGGLASGPVDGRRLGQSAVAAFEQSYLSRPELFPCTLGAFTASGAIVAAFKALIAAAQPLEESGFISLDTARRRSQSFDIKDSYDLIDFAQNLTTIAQDPVLRGAAGVLEQATIAARIAHCALGPSVGRSQGLAFWFPSSRGEWFNTSATYSALYFDRTTGWARYLRKFL